MTIYKPGDLRNDPEKFLVYLKTLIRYDQGSGLFFWIAGNRRGKPVCMVIVDGYRKCFIKGKSLMEHRLIWLFTYGKWPDGVTDHINGIRTDNRIENLRDVTLQENAQNVVRQLPNRTGFPGVKKEGNRWTATISIDDKVTHIGCYATPEEAHAAYMQKKLELHPVSTVAQQWARKQAEKVSAKGVSK